MTATLIPTDLPAPDAPRRITARPLLVDRIFFSSARLVGLSVLVITASIGVFLAAQSWPTLHHYGLSFFTVSEWDPDRGVVGISAVLLGTFTIAWLRSCSRSHWRSAPRSTSASTHRRGCARC